VALLVVAPRRLIEKELINMANQFNVELSMRQPPSEAQAHAATALTDAARAVGLRLTERGAAELVYKPRVQFPFMLMLWHTLNGERMTVRFTPGANGGTHVAISGAVAGSRHPLAANSEHWSEALGATPE
jgi:hypothetical protein